MMLTMILLGEGVNNGLVKLVIGRSPRNAGARQLPCQLVGLFAIPCGDAQRKPPWRTECWGVAKSDFAEVELRPIINTSLSPFPLPLNGKKHRPLVSTLRSLDSWPSYVDD
jgi:hypothetical protein